MARWLSDACVDDGIGFKSTTTLLRLDNIAASAKRRLIISVEWRGFQDDLNFS